MFPGYDQQSRCTIREMAKLFGTVGPDRASHDVPLTGTVMANQSAVPSHDGEQELLEGAAIPALPPSGPRKLIRPSLPEAARNRRSYTRRDTPLLIHQQPALAASRPQSSHAETFYLQKQMHAQTPMVFMLEGGDHIQGIIEWYDTDVIKVRNGNTRTLVYKSAIKYLYKAGESQT
jgi:sRNA-binding regulator protein Hfq